MQKYHSRIMIELICGQRGIGVPKHFLQRVLVHHLRKYVHHVAPSRFYDVRLSYIENWTLVEPEDMSSNLLSSHRAQLLVRSSVCVRYRLPLLGSQVTEDYQGVYGDVHGNYLRE